MTDRSERDQMNLEEVRTQKGISQTELDEKAGLHRGTINDIERGRNKRPAFEVVVRIARVLDVPAESLFPVNTENGNAA
jgi:DNA-binding XRE family transcriptional regulator